MAEGASEFPTVGFRAPGLCSSESWGEGSSVLFLADSLPRSCSYVWLSVSDLPVCSLHGQCWAEVASCRASRSFGLWVHLEGGAVLHQVCGEWEEPWSKGQFRSRWALQERSARRGGGEDVCPSL